MTSDLAREFLDNLSTEIKDLKVLSFSQFAEAKIALALREKFEGLGWKMDDSSMASGLEFYGPDVKESTIFSMVGGRIDLDLTLTGYRVSANELKITIPNKSTFVSFWADLLIIALKADRPALYKRVYLDLVGRIMGGYLFTSQYGPNLKTDLRKTMEILSIPEISDLLMPVPARSASHCYDILMSFGISPD